MSTQLQKSIHRQSDNVEGCRIGTCLRQPELMDHSVGVPDSMPTVLGLAQIKTIKMCQCNCCRALVKIRRWRQQNCLRLEARNPELRLSIRWCFRVAREIVTPSVGRTLSACARPVERSVLSSGSRGDILHHGGDIPKRSQRQECAYRAGRPPANANLCGAWRHPSNSGAISGNSQDGSFPNERRWEKPLSSETLIS